MDHLEGGIKLAAPPVKAVLQSFVDGAEVGGICHRSAVQGVVLQVYW